MQAESESVYQKRQLWRTFSRLQNNCAILKIPGQLHVPHDGQRPAHSARPREDSVVAVHWFAEEGMRPSDLVAVAETATEFQCSLLDTSRRRSRRRHR